MARLYTELRIDIEDQTGQEDPWYVTVRVPPIASVDDLADLLPQPVSPEELFADERFCAVMDSAKEQGQIPTRAELAAAIPIATLVALEARAAKQTVDLFSVATIVRQFASEPQNLLDDSGHALSWGRLAEEHEPYYRSAILVIARQILAAVRGGEARLAEKN